jgi:hypothetical protein
VESNSAGGGGGVVVVGATGAEPGTALVVVVVAVGTVVEVVVVLALMGAEGTVVGVTLVGVTVVGVTVVTVVDVTDDGVVFTVVVAVVTDWGKVVVVTVVVGDTTVVLVVLVVLVVPVVAGPALTDLPLAPAEAPGMAAPTHDEARVATMATVIATRCPSPGRDDPEENLRTTCPCCIAPPSDSSRSRGAESSVNGPAPATRLTQGVPWFCVASSRRVCLVILQIPHVLLRYLESHRSSENRLTQ